MKPLRQLGRSPDAPGGIVDTLEAQLAEVGRAGGAALKAEVPENLLKVEGCRIMDRLSAVARTMRDSLCGAAAPPV